MPASPRLALPFLAAGQAQKEWFHNEALQTLDLVTMAAVEEGPRASPPASPIAGSCYIIGPSPTGDWVGRAGQLAGYTSGGWRFVMPFDGMTVFVRSQAAPALYRANAWEVGTIRCTGLLVGGQQVIGARASAIANPSGGTVVDTEARVAIASILSAMRQHGLIV